MERIEAYFNLCVGYWMSQGVSKGVATVRALWWDCVEVWNADKSWNDDKVAFIKKWRSWYEPYGDIPAPDRVMEGNA